jgi:hypothetical protein
MKVDKTGYTTFHLDSEETLVFERVINSRNEKETLKAEDLGFKKELQIIAVFSRSHESDRDFLTKTAYFKQQLTVKIKKDVTYSYIFFEKGMSQVCLRNFEGNYTYSISLGKPLDKEDAGNRLYQITYAKPIKISDIEARKLLLSGNALLFDSDTLNSQTVLRAKI